MPNTPCLGDRAKRPDSSGLLSLVGTPIGNLGDLSPRAAETFRTADLICCEDTRVTSKLLAHLGISKSLMRCDDNVIAQRAPELVSVCSPVSASRSPRTRACRACPIPVRCLLSSRAAKEPPWRSFPAPRRV